MTGRGGMTVQERSVRMNPTPILPAPCYRTLMHTVSVHFGDLLSTWDAWSAATERFTAEQRSQGQALLTFLFGHLSEVAVQESAFIEGFLKTVSGLKPPLSAADVVLMLSDFEELLLSVVRVELPDEDQEPVYHWIHSLAAKLIQAYLDVALPPTRDTRRTTIDSTVSTSSSSSTAEETLFAKLLTFDEHLLSAHEASDVFHTVVIDSCGLAGFHRSALFLYNPLTRTVEGIYAHNIQLEEVRRIRENERRIPLLPAVLQIPKPVYIEDVTPVLPTHYVKHFGLTSLLVSPVRGPHGEPIGLLLADEGGQPFTEDSTRMNLMEQMLKRVSLALGVHLQSRARQTASRRSLTERELDVLRRIADGCDTKSIADLLHISEYTVTEHVTSILRKLSANNRASAVAKAFRAGLIR
jgi:DNA-binding CsgD family transcriptional regulator